MKIPENLKDITNKDLEVQLARVRVLLEDESVLLGDYELELGRTDRSHHMYEHYQTNYTSLLRSHQDLLKVKEALEQEYESRNPK